MTFEMNDKPLMVQDTPVRSLEVAAMLAYREMHPDGPEWQILHRDTRVMWLDHIERKTPNAEVIGGWRTKQRR